VIANSTLVTRIYFPRVYFPVAVALSSVVDLFFNLIALGVLMAFFGYVPGPAIVALPLILTIIYLASLGLALWFSALNVAHRDIAVIVPFITQVGFFVSPIIYPASIVPAELQPLYFLNPFALGIEAFRWSLLGTPPPPTAGWLVASATAVGLLITGYVYFRRREGTFADVI
jgi:lipopolysaccharide transport system permease protein